MPPARRGARGDLTVGRERAHTAVMRSYAVFLLLLAVKLASRALFRVRLEWIDAPEDPWSDLRVLALLNHTSLFEPVFAAVAPLRLLWQIAAHGVVPIADKTAHRPLVGSFFRFVAHQVVPVTRERDHTWTDFLRRSEDPRALIVILPEGRMKRRTGLDAHGDPMTIRGGIADILLGVRDGRLLLGYSQGLHHVHAPGDRWPRLFRRIRLRVEIVDIEAYRSALLARHGPDGFKAAVIADLTRRRDAWCPAESAAPALPRRDAASAAAPGSTVSGT